MNEAICYTEKQQAAKDRIEIRKEKENWKTSISDKSNLINLSKKYKKLDAEMKIMNVPLFMIKENPYQTRKVMDKDHLDGLINSISERGLINPITLLKSGNSYIIVNGHRRFVAFKTLKAENIPAIIKTRNENNELIVDLVHENLVREDLLPIEKAESIKLLFSEIKATENSINKILTLINILKNYKKRGYIPEHKKEQTKDFIDDDVFKTRSILKQLGISENQAVSYLMMLKLPKFIQEKICFTKGSIQEKGNVSISFAYQLARVEDKEYQEYLFNKIVLGSQLKIIQSLVDEHLKKVDRGEWKNLSITTKSTLSKFGDDIKRLNSITEESTKLAAKYASVKVDTLIKLENTIESEEFISVANALKKQLELLLGAINDKLIDKGIREINSNIAPFELELFPTARNKQNSRFSFPRKQIRLMNLDPDKKQILQIKIVGVKSE